MPSLKFKAITILNYGQLQKVCKIKFEKTCICHVKQKNKAKGIFFK